MPFSVTLDAWRLDAYVLAVAPPPGWVVTPQADGTQQVSGPAIDLASYMGSVTITDTSNDNQLTNTSGDTIAVDGSSHLIDSIYLSDSLIIGGQEYQIASIYYDGDGSVVSLPLIAGKYAAAFPGLLTGGNFDPSAPQGSLPTSSVVCFCRGTLIETGHGPVAIEFLKAGDLVQTKDHGLQPVRWIGSTLLHPRHLLAKPQIRPIRIKHGALGRNIPAQDLLVSPQHRILLKSDLAQEIFGCREILVAAKKLIPCAGIEVACDLTDVEYYHMLFDTHEIVLSNGAETESLYTGKEAMKALGEEARAEMLEIFPELVDEDFVPVPARLFATGQPVKKLTNMHVRTFAPLVD